MRTHGPGSEKHYTCNLSTKTLHNVFSCATWHTNKYS
jgi:hypothetical protein